MRQSVRRRSRISRRLRKFYSGSPIPSELQGWAEDNDLQLARGAWTADSALEACIKFLTTPINEFHARVDPKAKRKLAAKLDTEVDSAQAFCDPIEVHEKLDRLIASHEHRRDRTLREIELRREIQSRRGGRIFP